MLQGRLKRKKYLKLINNNINIYIYINIYFILSGTYNQNNVSKFDFYVFD